MYCLLISQSNVVGSPSGGTEPPSIVWHHHSEHIAWSLRRGGRPAGNEHHYFPASTVQNSHGPNQSKMGLANTWQCLPKRLWARGQKISFLFLWRSDSILTGRGFSSHFSSKFWDLDLNLVISGHFSGAGSPDIPGFPGWNTISVTSNSTWINSQRFWKVNSRALLDQ